MVSRSSQNARIARCVLGTVADPPGFAPDRHEVPEWKLSVSWKFFCRSVEPTSPGGGLALEMETFGDPLRRPIASQNIVSHSETQPNHDFEEFPKRMNRQVCPGNFSGFFRICTGWPRSSKMETRCVLETFLLRPGKFPF